MKTGKIDGKIDDLWELVYDSGELTEAVSSITISNLLGNTDEEYQLICRFIDDDTTGSYYLRFNNDSGNNYKYQYIDGTNNVISALRDTSESQIYLGYTNTDSNICFSKHLIYAKSGYVRTVISETATDISATTITSIKILEQIWNNTVDEITSMVISASNDKMNIGSRIILLKKVKITTGLKSGDLNIQGTIKGNWLKIYETTLTEAATSVTISSLNGNNDIIYRLRCRFINGYNGASNYFLRPNNDSDNDYGYQEVDGTASTGSALRDTSEAQINLGYTAAQNNLSMSDIIFYVKSGYLRTVLTKIEKTITGTTVTSINLKGQVYQDTSTNIISLVILVDQTNGLGIGTYICLEKLSL